MPMTSKIPNVRELAEAANKIKTEQELKDEGFMDVSYVYQVRDVRTGQHIAMYVSESEAKRHAESLPNCIAQEHELLSHWEG